DELNYDDLASGLKAALEQDKSVFDADRLQKYTGFRDHSVYKGHQVFFYKRAQIFAADLYGAFKGQGYGDFHDITSITIFADYIVPAVLRELGVLTYHSDLANVVDSHSEITAGSEEEVELRACSIYAAEKMRDLIQLKSGNPVLSVELDLWLWAHGVQQPSLQYHITLSFYY
ncbi:Queuosine salvage protein, partial [Linum grandiflorum]